MAGSKPQRGTMRLDQHFFCVELYSGTGSVSSMLKKVLNMPCISIDMDPKAGADITMNLLHWSPAAAAQVKQLAGVGPGCSKRCILWASPPCTDYSRLKANAPRDLDTADACVAVVQRIAADLDAAVVLVENPATGLLKDRPVIDFMEHRVEVHYCQYGFAYRKPTMVWSSVDLGTAFEAKTCPGWPHCQSMLLNPATNRPCHMDDMAKLEYSQRISVPRQLVNLLARALQGLLPPLAHKPKLDQQASRKRHREKAYVVNYISQAALLKGVLKVKVYWVGYDSATWIPISNLNADPAEYDYLRPAVRDWVLARHKLLQPRSQQQQQSRQQQQQSQQQQLKTGRAGCDSLKCDTDHAHNKNQSDRVSKTSSSSGAAVPALGVDFQKIPRKGGRV